MICCVGWLLVVYCRKYAKSERVLFHYNGHGVPKPTSNGEIWFFNRTQYIPLPINDLDSWLKTPSIYVFDCSAAGMIANAFIELQDWTPSSSSSGTSPRDCILLAACEAHETLPQSHEFPADVFTSCLTTPIKIALRWFCTRSLLHESLDYSLIDRIPGRQTDRKTLLGELNWRSSAFVYYSLDCSPGCHQPSPKGMVLGSLSGHASPIESVTCDSTQVLVAAGGSSGVVKLWELEETKVFRTLNGHRSYYTALEFHHFGSSDRTVKFWDLETFELIGTTRAEETGVRSVAFHPDGRTLFCGLDNSLKVYSWEPIISHDAVDIGWSTLGDLCIDDGKLLG
ncbi:unnamed protein product [Lactuca virosa]|uniref:Raptor N-terminal CASPase-like domain-containing protein n=1 Tax=Lactuca virosa TaxID=75947 RepID=A0AAU9LIR2_9ASTR|nr:unnamed protein product [Lactuca virosa]